MDSVIFDTGGQKAMPRFARQPSGTGYYHILTRGNNRMGIFSIDRDYQTYLEVLARYKQQFSWELHHFCLMPNHVHLLVHIEEFRVLKKIMQGINQVYEKYFRKRYQHSGHLWQGRYKSIPIESDEYLLECARYIERNPVRAGIVEDSGEYPWSSYKFYAGGKQNKLLKPSPGFLALGATPERRQESYQAYVAVPRPYEEILDRSLKIKDVPRHAGVLEGV